ncbi:MAG: YraN family protein [Syntrophomonadaceae bacterium]|nr:YraN family protein [Syntrophomonadaceae bacterium]
MVGAKTSRTSTGRAGEDAALKYLSSRHYHLLARNYRCHLGEVDLIMSRGDKLVFVEVRSKSGTRFGQPQESVGAAKLSRLRRIAEYYLGFELRGGWSGPVGLEVVAVNFSPSGQVERIEHITDIQ